MFTFCSAHPGRQLEDARRTLDFTVKHAPEIGFLNLALFNMPVGSLEARELKTSSFYEGDLSLYTDFEHPGGWSRKSVRQFIEGEFKRARDGIGDTEERTAIIYIQSCILLRDGVKAYDCA